MATRLLVVDASVIKSAGETEHPTSSACRQCLLDIKRICHRVAVTPAIQKEWDRHMSKVSRKWLVSMHAKRKIEHTKTANLDINVSALSSADQLAFEKDQHLLEAACSADHIIITRDEALRSIISQISLSKTLQLINPVNNGTNALEGLKS